MRFRNIEIFHVVMQHGSVSAAAKHLGISQPSATKRLQQAEDELDYKLFDRIRGRLFPTEEARMLFAEVKRVYQALESVQGMSRRIGGSFDGHFRVAAPPALALELLPESIAQFATRYRSVTLEISTQHSGDILGASALLANRFDLGFTFGAETAPGLNVIEIGRAPIMCAVSRRLLPTAGTTLSLAEIAGLPFIGLDETEPLGGFVKRYCFDHGLNLNSPIRAHAHHVALALAARGIGVAIVDWFTARFHADRATASDLLILPIDPPAMLPVTAVYFATDGLPLPARHFIAAVQSVLASSGAQVEQVPETQLKTTRGNTAAI